MKDYAIVALFTTMKGFFKTKISGEYILLGLKEVSNNTFMLFQFFQSIEKGLYLVGTVGGMESPSEDALEDKLDDLRHSHNVKILEDKLPIKAGWNNSKKAIVVTFNKKPSKYLGKTLEFHNDSRIPDGYYAVKAKVKKDFEPAIQYKFSSGAMGLGMAKKMRAFTSARLK